MPIRRRSAVPTKTDPPPSNAPEEGDATAESSAPVEGEKNKDPAVAAPVKEEEKEGEVKEENANGEERAITDGETPNEGEKPEEAPAEKTKSKKKKAKEVVDKIEKDGDDKGKKVKKKIPSWATISANKVVTTNLSNHRAEDIIIEAIESCKEQRGGASSVTIIKYAIKKYPSVEMDKKTKNLYKKALKRLVEKGAVRQLKGKGFSGSFVIGKKPAVSASQKETLGEALPLIMTRLCEPKEASYILIKKYLEQHFPQLNVENRPDVLKNCLQRSVEKGYLEQITGKGASGTFQLKKAGSKVLMCGGLLEEAVVAAITAMNEPKTCSIATLRKFLVDKQKNANFAVVNLKRTLQKCKVMGWMEQISGQGLSGTYQLSYPYFPSPAVLFPEMMEKLKKVEEEKAKRKRKSEDSSEEEDESEEESDYEEPPPKKRAQRAKPVSRSKANKSRSNSRKPAPAKRSVTPAKKTAQPAKKPPKKAPEPAKPAKATPVKKAAPTSKPKTPAVKKMTSRGSKRPAPKAAKAEAKPPSRKSLRAKK
ncbi:heterochromatin protein 1-binding protein 3 [Triplophysa dalaica]|uniref:heterochromatin protein 1-binding protein 3 n=1 Tax=Triplophysa dalaica TaxID=1582913 RepID=UPI0024E03F5C|nr:heterochromatin protein 1-binding protein 3 [Triplophysa dalaica]XP_056591631.1 heterochromatin protein 1-binding protein 3 [Triplophysa dalaica]